MCAKVPVPYRARSGRIQHVAARLAHCGQLVFVPTGETLVLGFSTPGPASPTQEYQLVWQCIMSLGMKRNALEAPARDVQDEFAIEDIALEEKTDSTIGMATLMVGRGNESKQMIATRFLYLIIRTIVFLVVVHVNTQTWDSALIYKGDVTNPRQLDSTRSKLRVDTNCLLVEGNNVIIGKRGWDGLILVDMSKSLEVSLKSVRPLKLL